MSVDDDQRDFAGRRSSDAPALVRGNLRPASITVSSALAEDTVIAGVMDIAEGRNTVAMFANPFNDGFEEMLYVDERDTLMWARHLNGVVSSGGVVEQNGWGLVAVAPSITEVVVAVHPQGSVWAFGAQVLANGKTRVVAFELAEDASVPGGLRWADREVDGLPADADAGSRLSVQYLGDRPAAAVVFCVDPGAKRIYFLTPVIPAGAGQRSSWRCGGSAPVDAKDLDGLGAVGLDGPELAVGAQTGALNVLRAYSLHPDGSLWRTTTTLAPMYSSKRQQVHTGWTSIVGIWTSSGRAGCLGTGIAAGIVPQADTLLATYPDETGGVPSSQIVVIRLDQRLDDLVAWQDEQTRLHVYGRGADRGVHVLHQLDWQLNSTTGVKEPVWDQHANPHGDPNPMATTRPLFPDVTRFAVDGFPDDMPSQHAMHAGVAPGESCAIYTQQVGTTYWDREKIRLVPDTLPAPYPVPRYETTLTVLNAFGAAIPGCQVNLTADAAVDLEVAGRFYRTGPITPVTLATDGAGRITLRVVAAGLSVPAMHVSAPGLAQAVTVQQAAGVHKFLAGAGTLPNHPDGFTAATVTNAANADGTPLFPNINRGDAATATWPPSAADVVSWCQGAFAVSSGDTLPPTLTAGLGNSEPVLAFSIQTHDPNRPGLQAYTSTAQLAARRALLTEQGIFEGAADWFGDIVQGIRAGMIAVAEVVIHVATRALELLVELADGAKIWLTGAWDDITSAAHAVESAFNAVGAKLKEALDFLEWALDVKDIFDTKKAIDQAIRELPALVTPYIAAAEGYAHGWFVSKEAEVVEAFEAMKAAVAGKTIGSFNAPPALPVQGTPPASVVGVKDHVDNPHVGWLQDKLTRTTQPGEQPAELDLPDGFSDALDDLIKAISESPAWPDFLAALEDVGTLFTNLFDYKDPATLAAAELTTLLDLVEHLIKALLELADSLVGAVLEFGKAVLVQLPILLDTAAPVPQLVETVWAWLQEAAGVEPKPLTIGDIGCMLAAFPTTLMFKVVQGSAPFPGGSFPGWPRAFGEGNVDDPTSGWYLAAQMIWGILQISDVVWWTLLDADELGAPVPMARSLWAGVAALHFFKAGLRFPLLWGLPMDDFGDLAAYLSWALDLMLNGLDLNSALRGQMALLGLVAVGPGGIVPLGIQISTMLGVLQWIFAGVRFAANDRGDVEALALATNLLRYEPLVTTVCRYLHAKAPTQLWANVMFGVKSALDLLCPAAAGVITVYQSGYTAGHPLELTTLPSVGPGRVGDTYPEARFGATGGWPPYTWSAEPLLPDGLQLDKSTGVLSGTPRSVETRRFTVQAKDAYGPAASATTPELTIEIT